MKAPLDVILEFVCAAQGQWTVCDMTYLYVHTYVYWYVTWLIDVRHDSCLIDVFHEPLIRDVTHWAYISLEVSSYARGNITHRDRSEMTWRIHTTNDSFLCDMTHWFVTWLIHMCRYSCIQDMTQCQQFAPAGGMCARGIITHKACSYVTWQIHMWYSHVTRLVYLQYHSFICDMTRPWPVGVDGHPQVSRARAATLPTELALSNAGPCSGELITCLLETCPDLVSKCNVMQHTATHNGSCCSHYLFVGDVSRCGGYSCGQITLDPPDFGNNRKQLKLVWKSPETANAQKKQEIRK